MDSCRYEEVGVKNEYKNSFESILKQSLIGSTAAVLFFVCGLCGGATTVIIPQMRREANSTSFIDDELASWMYSTAAFAIFPWIFVLPIATNHWGRKPPQLAASVCCIIIFTIFFFSHNPYHIIIAQAFVGFLIAGNITNRVLVIIDYTSPEYRGIFLIIKSASVYWGIWVANAIGTFYSWRYIPILGFCCSLYTFNALFWPESPFWLAKNGRYDECKASYEWINGRNEKSEKEVNEIILSANSKRFVTSIGLQEMLKSREFYKPASVCIVMMFQYHFSGKIVSSLYILDMFRSITEGETAAYTAMLILDGVTVSGMYFGTYLSNILKRRTLFFTSSLTAVFVLFAISLYLFLVKLEILEKDVYIIIALLTLYSISISCGPPILALTIYGELIPIRYQATCYVIAGLTYASCYSVLAKLTPLTYAYFGVHGTFLFYGVTCGLATIYLYFHMPETTNKTRQEIDNFFRDAKMTIEECKPM